MDEGVVARCVSCTGALPIVFRESRPCPYCGTAEPLHPALRARVAEVARTIRRAGSREQIPASLRESVGSLGWMALVLVSGSWLVAGPITVGWVAHDLPERVGLIEFAISGRAPGMSDKLDVTMFWWLLFAVVVLVALTFLWVWGAQLRLYVAIRGTRCLPPFAPGGPARCRLCGDDLPARGTVRRCESCGADNLVDGAHFRAAAASYETAARQIERAHKHDFGQMLARVEGGVMYAAGLPFALLLLVPVTIAFDGPRPDLWWIPGVIFGLAVLARITAFFAKPSHVARSLLPTHR